MKKVFTRGGRSSVSLILLAVLLSSVQVLAQTQQPAIPSTFFGIHVNNPTITTGETSYPVQVTYGNFRNWDVYGVSSQTVTTYGGAGLSLDWPNPAIDTQLARSPPL